VIRLPSGRTARRRLGRTLLCTSGFLIAVAPAWSEDLVVCAEKFEVEECRFFGGAGIQRAVDEAANGDRIVLRAGRYLPDGYRDVAFDDLTIRGHVLVEDKTLTMAGEPGAILDAGAGEPASSVVVHRGSLTLEGVTIRDARAASPEDNVYDGHGVFVVDGDATLDNVTFRSIEKMALSIRGDSAVDARNVSMTEGHVGVWIEEDATLHLEDCAFADNDSAAVAAYASSTVEVGGCVFDGNLDDGLYAAGAATISATGSLFVRNTPYAVRSVDEATITVRNSIFYANAAVANDGEESGPRIHSSRFFSADSLDR
jgi:hypothetical protein